MKKLQLLNCYVLEKNKTNHPKLEEEEKMLMTEEERLTSHKADDTRTCTKTDEFS